jgi:hypothetical protein
MNAPARSSAGSPQLLQRLLGAVEPDFRADVLSSPPRIRCSAVGLAEFPAAGGPRAARACVKDTICAGWGRAVRTLRCSLPRPIPGGSVSVPTAVAGSAAVAMAWRAGGCASCTTSAGTAPGDPT